ncbi:hypothetical protein GcM1_207024 [Golovinomyces cichoracearum]|uniref:Uncharacterized protein n=1 Tax=Golovinomyces cichoracearum TaxID=62708 RepID=A0A420IWF6_9PEZI|nr:hypothetical protein GcM1_207024 [Golovinomyces cichoracearum]
MNDSTPKSLTSENTFKRNLPEFSEETVTGYNQKIIVNLEQMHLHSQSVDVEERSNIVGLLIVQSILTKLGTKRLERRHRSDGGVAHHLGHSSKLSFR